jgi:hypothetical protein
MIKIKHDRYAIDKTILKSKFIKKYVRLNFFFKFMMKIFVFR